MNLKFAYEATAQDLGVACAAVLGFMRMELRFAAVKRVDRAAAMERDHMHWALIASAAVFFIGLFATLPMSLVIGRWRGEK